MGRTREITDSELLDRLTDVFRHHGYEGASLTRITEATGLKRASLYHRFPGGKRAMAQAVLDRADAWLVENAIGPLDGPGEASGRIREMARALSSFYGHGRNSCLLDAFSLGGEERGIRNHVRESMKAWIGALARVLRDEGIPAGTARRRAEDAVAGIQGTLVVARATGNTAPFKRLMKQLPEVLLAGAE